VIETAVEPAEPVEPVKSTAKVFGTFAGVFTPTELTILGVIMYLRLPWVVGIAGLLGTWLILALAFGITAATGLSPSAPPRLLRDLEDLAGVGADEHIRPVDVEIVTLREARRWAGQTCRHCDHSATCLGH
jgi:hypothetical protein